MPELSPGKPVTSKIPELLVENKLEAGRYRFELVVVDDSGLESAPAELVVSVQAAGRTKETLVIKPDPSVRLSPTPTPTPEPVFTVVKPVLQPTKPVVEPVVTLKPGVLRPVKPK